MRMLLASLALWTVPSFQETPADTPKDGIVSLFNGKDLAGLTTWLKDTKIRSIRSFGIPIPVSRTARCTRCLPRPAGSASR